MINRQHPCRSGLKDRAVMVPGMRIKTCHVKDYRYKSCLSFHPNESVIIIDSITDARRLERLIKDFIQHRKGVMEYRKKRVKKHEL